ncbi:MAG: ATP-binding cassette domain-containing protein [Clostridia bacterium]|nr:ATP-binding cassette domain-containing protein [Clostridia bacterium]
MSDFLKNTFEKLYQAYRAHSGKKKIAFDSRHDALDFIIDQGVPLCIFALGGYYVYLRRLAIGILVGSPFLISAVQQFWTYGVKWIEAFRAAPQVAERIRIFYGAMETEEDKQKNFEPLQEIHGKWLTFRYKRELEPTVRNASFSIQHGQCLRIVGPNGCGKSTLASLISGLYPPDEGKLADEKGWPLHVNRLRRSVAFQEQNGAVFSGTLFENLFIQPSDTNKAISLMQEFGLEKSLDEWIEPEGANLSPGERKKVLLIRALLKQAPFCVLDEPFNHLDEQGKQALIKHLKNSSQGLILISHQDFFPASHILQLTNDH